ncbi:MAG: DUF5784 family protein [Haloquadratum sp.]
MARPLRFRYAPGRWTQDRVTGQIYRDLDRNLGAVRRDPWFRSPDRYAGERFEMDNGDTALFLWNDDEAYWLGNTETPEALWHTDKYGFAAVPDDVSRWATRELTAQLHAESPWLEPYPHLSWFFLPVFLSKDGRETTRRFFDHHAAGFPDATRDEALEFYESFLRTRSLDDSREVMAGKLGTSEYLDLTRMTAAMGEFNAGHLLVEAGYDIDPEISVSTGHAIDYRAEGDDGTAALVEVTRPTPTDERRAGTPVAAVRDTAATKADGQLEAHGGGVVLLVDCSSFPDDEWQSIRAERPDVHHRPAVVFRLRPSGSVEGYTKGRVPLDIEL